MILIHALVTLFEEPWLYHHLSRVTGLIPPYAGKEGKEVLKSALGVSNIAELWSGTSKNSWSLFGGKIAKDKSRLCPSSSLSDTFIKLAKNRSQSSNDKNRSSYGNFIMRAHTLYRRKPDSSTLCNTSALKDPQNLTYTA